MKVAVLTDTNSGIGVKEANELGIYLVPMPVIIDEETFYEGRDISEEEFYSALKSTKKLSTSQPLIGDVVEIWEALFKKGYDEVLFIPMSSGLSGSCTTAQSFALEYDGRVQVVDNHRISVTMRQSVLKAIELIKEGKSAEEARTILEHEAYNSTIYLAVENLEYLKRGGRITAAAATIGTMLNIKPILSIFGEKIDSFAKSRGSMTKCQTKMLDIIEKDLHERFPGAKDEQVYVGAAGAGLNEEEKEAWTNMVRERFPNAHVYYDPLSFSVGTHTGPGAVGIGLSVDNYQN